MKDAQPLTPELMLQGYASGIFPMAETRNDPDVFWVEPRRRGIMPLDGFHISRSLRRRLAKGDFAVTVNTDFSGVVRACAARDDTWINDLLFDLYRDLHDNGFAHSLEVRGDDGALMGGVYGVTLGGAFFGESMFSHRTDGSKIALTFLVDRLNCAGFRLFDVQFLTPHLASLGAIEIPRARYRRHLSKALEKTSDFNAPPLATAQGVIQRNTQIS